MRKILRVALLCFLAAAGLARAQRWGQRLDGSALPVLAPPATRAVMLFFVASDCPISNRLFPEMLRLRDEFAGRGVRAWFVYPNTTEDVATIKEHQKAFGGGADALQDPSGALVRLTHAVATPELAVLVPGATGWRTVYAGRVDDRYVRIGLERPAATVHFGEDAVNAVLAGRMPAPPVGRPVGCAIMNPGVQ